MSEKTFGEYEIGDEFLYDWDGQTHLCTYRITAQTATAMLLEDTVGTYLPTAVDVDQDPWVYGMKPAPLGCDAGGPLIFKVVK